ncbi:phage portal protein [Burkholderia sola]|uniref:phage portal protein n=1 Tax=Burkholderia TaxID=32008 RepID=UPI001AE1A8F0|nr:phage portal protein [Burkholderia sp. AcTa6-5]MBP0714820.1 phage portal protein [Burkholderia sp. AcTa6-5]
MFISRIRADIGAPSDKSPWGNFWFAPLGYRSTAGSRVTATSALSLPDVLACVRVLAESFAIMPFELYKPKAGGGRTREHKHWLYKLIEKAPNRFQSPYEYRMMLAGHLALRGNAFSQITANGAGEITELLPLHPDRMSIEPLSNGSYRYRYVDQNAQIIYYSRHEIWHLRGMSDDGYMGLSLIGLAREAFGEGLSMQDYSTRFFANDAKPGGGWIEYPGTFGSKEVKQQFRDSWQEMQGGANRGKVAVLERGMKFHELGMNNKDSQFIEARGAKTTEIARIFRVPPHKIGDLSKATFSNIEHLSIEFWTDTMLPWARLWEYSMCFNLLGPDSDLDPEFDHKPMMRGDGVARAGRISTLVTAGVMTRNEGRGEEGYDPLAGLDKPLMPLNVTTVDAAGEPTVTKGAPPPAKLPAPTQDDQGDNDASARLARVLRGNAERLARRVVAGQPVPARLLAEALGISEELAATWSPDPSDTVEQLTIAFLSLGSGDFT